MSTAIKKDFSVVKGIEATESIRLGDKVITNLIDSSAVSTVAQEPDVAAAIVGAGGKTVKSYDSADLLPLSNNDSGEFAFVKSTDRLYLWNGSGWYNIALINTTPTLSTTPDSSYSMDSTGASLSITILGTDPEEVPITYSHVASDSAASLVTITQDSSVFTVTPLTQSQLDSNGYSSGGTFTITFRASDGVNIAPAVSSFTLDLTISWSAGTQQANIQTNVTSGAPVFGYSLDLDNNGDTMITGAKGDTTQANDTAGNNKGTLSIYTRSGSTWSRQQKIVNPYNSSGTDEFGYSSAISGDGNTVVVGTPSYYNSSSSTTTGIASVYTKSGSTWRLSKSLTSGNTQADQLFGSSIDVDSNATRIVVGARSYDHPSKSNVGYGFVYYNAGTIYYNIEYADYQDFSPSFASQDATPTSFLFNGDGTKLIMTGYTGDAVYQYSLSTAYDITTMSYDNVSFDLSSQSAFPRNTSWNSNGTKYFVVDLSSRYVYEYSLSTAYDISTMSYSNNSYYIGQDSSPQGLTFKPDGTKMYITGGGTNHVREYSLSSGFDLSSTVTYVAGFSLSGQSTSPESIEFNNDGTKMFICCDSTDKIFQYSLSTAYDITSASYDNVSLSIVSEENQAKQIRFATHGSNAGDQLYVLGVGGDRIKRYTTTGLDITQEASLFPSDYNSIGNSPEVFQSVAINSTGDTIVAGGSQASASATGSGVAYIFTRSGTTWTQQARIMPSAIAAGDDYGIDVDISDDGNTVVVGAIYDDDDGSNAGAAYVWTRSGSTWSEAATLTASDGEANANFGHGVAISGTGDSIVIGSNKFNGATGKAYVFQLSSGTWSQTKILTASDASSSSEFGWQTAFNQNGSTCAVSAYETDNGTSTQAGSVYIYTAS